MTDTNFLVLLKSKPKKLTFANKKLKALSPIIGRFDSVAELDLSINQLDDLPLEIGNMKTLKSLNLGENDFTDIPFILKRLRWLRVLHFFRNKVQVISPGRLNSFKFLTALNLNGNQLRSLPPEIGRLEKLELLSVAENKLGAPGDSLPPGSGIPVDICALTRLKELHLERNFIQYLPAELGYLLNLETLDIHSNKLKELPESFSELFRLKVLDVAANELRMFPADFGNLNLREIYCEENPLIKPLTVRSVQEDEALSLKELCARFVMKDLRNRWTPLRARLRNYPALREMLARCGFCPVCGQAFLETWLECVRFIEPRKTMGSSRAPAVLPVRAQLCSYRCFNQPGHQFYGVVFASGAGSASAPATAAGAKRAPDALHETLATLDEK